MDTALQDIRYALRVLRKSPGFTLVSVLTLALGIVGTTLVFNAYNATVWQPLPVSHPERLAVLDRYLLKGGDNDRFSTRDYRQISEHSRVFSAVAAERQFDTVLAQFPDAKSGKLDEARQALVKVVSENYFDVLGVGAAAGRVFGPGDKPANGPVAVISDLAWRRRFQRNPAVLGKTIMIYGAAVTIAGVAPPDFVGSGNPPIAPDVWVPLFAEPVIEPQRASQSGAQDWLRIVGRLQPNATLAQAESELTALAQQDEKERGIEPVTASIAAKPPVYFIEPGNPQFRALAAMLLASFSMVLLVACANMANFFLARATARRREMAVRTALGASRGRLVRQLITEGVLLGLGGGAVALVAATWLCDVIWVEIEDRIIARFTDLYVFNFTFTPSLRVLAATTVVSVIAGALFSLAGAVQSSRVDLNEVMKGCELTVAPGRRLRLSMRDLLIGVQVTLSVVLLVSAALLARGMIRGQSSDPGFNTHNVLNIEFDGLSTAGYDGARAAVLREQLRKQFATTPGIRNVAFTRNVPLLGYGTSEIMIPGGEVQKAYNSQVTPGFFETLDIAVTRGRDFSDSEVANEAAVVIVSQATARNLWPGQDPIGKMLLVGSYQMSSRWQKLGPMVNGRRALQVIGVAQDVRSVNIGMIQPYFLYLPLPPDAPLDDILLRTGSDASSSVGEALKAVSAVDRKLASLGVARSLDDALWYQRLPSTIATMFASAVGILAMVLASVGIYGTIAYAVARRTREIGIRMALGAPNWSILRLVLSRTMTLVGGGTAVGLVLAAMVSRAITAVPFGLQSTLLFGTSPRDPLSFAAVGLFLAFVAAAAAYRPALKATKVDPMVALRYE